MSFTLNKVQLIGFLGAKPELKYLPSGQAVCEMRVATSEEFTDKENKPQKRTEWHRIVAWGKQGEICAKHLDKGRQVWIEGKLQTRSWEDKSSGEKRYMTETVARVVGFLGKNGNLEKIGEQNDDAPSSAQGDDELPSAEDTPF